MASIFRRVLSRSRASSRLAGAAAFCLFGAGLASSTQRDRINSDEEVVLFAGYATEASASSWTARVRGWIFEPESGLARSQLKRTLEGLIGDRFGMSRDEVERESAQAGSPFARRAGMFLVDNERDQRVNVSAAGSTTAMGASEPNGHFEVDVTLPAAAGKPGDWVEIRAVTEPSDTRVFAGKVQLIQRTGVSVVSDIDDTIKHSDVLNKGQLALNTFFRDFRAAPGMSALYQRWAGAGNVVFHYVSGSPFQLYADLADFARRDAFPAGSFHLRKFRLKDRESLAEFFGDPKAFKLGTIAPILKQFSDRRFVLVGDSGEKDPEVYTELAAKHSNVDAIFIRDVSNTPARSAEIQKLFAPLPARVVRRIFINTSELDDFTPTPRNVN
jgi:phosphatidate phosphatase APP1